MQVLIIDGYDAGHVDAHVVATAIETLEGNGNVVEHLSLHREGFDRYMTAEERQAYLDGDPLVTDEAKRSAELIAGSTALLLCYPTTMFTVPARLKSWLERALVPGVAFVLDEKNKVRPAMTQIRRLGEITTTPHGRIATARARGRTVNRNLRLNCHPRCRRMLLRLPAGAVDATKVTSALKNWK